MSTNNRLIRSVSWMLLTAILSQGCTNFHKQDVRVEVELEELNRKGASEKARIYLKDGYKYSAARLEVQPDSSFWYAGDGVLPVHRPTPDIDKVIFIDRPRGALDAFLFGAIPGFVYGGLFAFAMSNGMGGQDLPTSMGLGLAYALGGGLITGLMAAPLGWVMGHKYIYEIYDPTLEVGKYDEGMRHQKKK